MLLSLAMPTTSPRFPSRENNVMECLHRIAENCGIHSHNFVAGGTPQVCNGNRGMTRRQRRRWPAACYRKLLPAHRAGSQPVTTSAYCVLIGTPERDRHTLG